MHSRQDMQALASSSRASPSLKPVRCAVTRTRLVTKALVQQQAVVVGDIGGTNARLSAWLTSPSSRESQEVFAKTYPTSQFSTFDACLGAFLAEPSVRATRPASAALAVAGAVADNRCSMTNVKWVVDGHKLQGAFGIRVSVLNDFEAVGYGIPALQEGADYITVNNVKPIAQAPKVVMGPGTGLGAAQLAWDSGLAAYKVLPGEGSHATFAARGWKQQALAAYVTAQLGHCEIEQVACGSGLELIYSFLLTDEIANRPELLVHPTKKRAEQISAAALSGTDPLAVEAVDMFFAIVGAEAGAMALRCLAKGGVYIAGGITPKLCSRALAGSLLEGFLLRKGRPEFYAILAATPLYIITNEKVGQLGAIETAKRLA